MVPAMTEQLASIPPRQLHEAARGLLEHYRITRPRLKLLRRQRNVVFRVDAPDGRRLVLRLTPSARFSNAAARVQLGWMKSLARLSALRGMPTPLKTTSRLSFVEFLLGGMPVRCIVLSWTPGRPPRGATFLKPDALRLVGRATAIMHAHAAKHRPAEMNACPKWGIDRFFGDGTCIGASGKQFFDSTNDHDVVRRAGDRISRALRRTANSPEHVGLIHGDLEPPNWIFHRGQVRPIDFDEFGVGHYLYDLMQVIWTHALWEQYPTFRTILLAGYESIRPIRAEDRRELDLFQAIPFIVWLNRGLAEERSRDADFRKWVRPTVRRIGELCGADKP
jgi:Ser/Thr protein kinase RdoA (MazF antagonist)